MNEYFLFLSGSFMYLRWGHYVSFSVLDARALDLGRALPKKDVFFLPSARIRLLPISEKTVYFGR